MNELVTPDLQTTTFPSLLPNHLLGRADKVGLLASTAVLIAPRARVDRVSVCAGDASHNTPVIEHMSISIQNNQVAAGDTLRITADDKTFVVRSTEVRIRRIRLARRGSRAFTRRPDAGSLHQNVSVA